MVMLIIHSLQFVFLDICNLLVFCYRVSFGFFLFIDCANGCFDSLLFVRIRVKNVLRCLF